MGRIGRILLGEFYAIFSGVRNVGMWISKCYFITLNFSSFLFVSSIYKVTTYVNMHMNLRQLFRDMHVSRLEYFICACVYVIFELIKLYVLFFIFYVNFSRLDLWNLYYFEGCNDSFCVDK